LFANAAAAASACICANSNSCCIPASNISPNFLLAAILLSISSLTLSRICLCSSAAFKFTNLNFSCSAEAISAAFANCTSALAPSNALVVTSFIPLTTFFVTSATLSNVPSTPVKVSINSLPASFADSAAPAKSPLNTFTIASPKNPIASNADSNFSIMFALIAAPKSLTLCNGSSNIALKNPTTLSELSITKFINSLNIFDTVPNAIAKASLNL